MDELHPSRYVLSTMKSNNAAGEIKYWWDRLERKSVDEEEVAMQKMQRDEHQGDMFKVAK
mgnify:CR=1 FL=1